VGVAMIIFVFSLNRIWGVIEERRTSFVRLTENSALYTSFQEMKDYIEEEYPVTVLWCYNEFPLGNIAEALLPFSTKNHQPILYTTNIVDPSTNPEVKFKRFGKIQINYLLSREPVTLPWLQETHSTEYYHLYKIIDNKK